VLEKRKKLSKNYADYKEEPKDGQYGSSTSLSSSSFERRCGKCKFNLGDGKKCHIVEGQIDNEKVSPNSFPQKERGCYLEILYGIILRRIIQE
jgi:hypothetical protein